MAFFGQSLVTCKLTLGVTFLLVALVTSVPAFASESNNESYEKALKKLWERNYDDAAVLFDAAGDYEDASLYADYCRALALGENGSYSVAINNLLSLGNFRDSALQAIYYQGLSYETAEQYEQAMECFNEYELFRDIADRLSSYPEKILERDYKKADKYEQGGQLEKALEAFKALGKYKDSSERTSKISEMITENNYVNACSLEEADNIIQAYNAFVSLGSYKDSKSHAEALFEEVKYREGQEALKDGHYDDARESFLSIADYKDSSDILYMLGVIDHADLKHLSEKSALYEFHEKYGLINLDSNTVTLPEWDEITQISENCFRAKNNDYYGLIDAEGERLTMCNWKSISPYAFDDMLTGFQGPENDMTVSLLDTKGNVYVNGLKSIGDSKAGKWESAETPYFSNNLIRAENQESKWGFIDKEGNTIIDFIYQDANEYINGFAAVEASDKWGFIDPSGTVVIDLNYKEVEPFSKEGFAHVREDNDWKVIDTSGHTVYFIDPLLIKGNGTEEEKDAVNLQRMAQDVRSLLMQGKISEAESLAKKAGDNPEVSLIFESGKLEEAKKKYKEGDIDQAISFVKKLTSDEAKELSRLWSIEKARALFEDALVSDAFDTLKGYEDDPEVITMEIEIAKALHDEGDYDNAIAIIENNEGDEAANLYPAWILEKAKSLYENGEIEKALKILQESGDSEAIETGKQWAIENAKDLVENGQILRAIDLLTPFSEDPKVSKMISEFEGQMETNNNPSGTNIELSICICTAGVLEDGHIYQVGFTDNGINNASTWKDIIAFDYGTGHVVGLRRDGTVMATGDNTVGQCEVGGWSSIVSISAGNGLTLGLRSDGTVSAAGVNDEGQCNVSDWTDITAVSAGGFHALGLKKDGTVVAVGNNEYGQCNVSDWTDIIAVAAGQVHSIGLRSDGTVVATGDDSQKQCRVSEWNNIVAISAGDYHSLGLTAEQTVLATGHNRTNECNVKNWKDIVAIAAGGQDSMAINADGVVLATGYNDYKQLAIDGHKIDLPDKLKATSTMVYSDKETIQKVQTILNEKGYDCGTPDGDAGPKTQEAIQKYKTDNALEANAVIDDDLLNSLGIQ